MDGLVNLTIHDLSSDGDGVGQSEDGIAVFVPFTAPGDRVSVRIVEQKKRFARGEIVEILEQGPGRTEPQCGVFGECGGCAWQHLEYGVQIEAKQNIIAAALERIGKFELPGPVEITRSPEPYGYRSRARVISKDNQLGYFKRGTNEFCRVDSCPILLAPLQEKWGSLLGDGALQEGGWDFAAGTNASSGDDVRALPSEEGVPQGPRIVLDVLTHRAQLSPGSFAQANPFLFDALASAVCEHAGRDVRLLELYCGSGFFTLPLSDQFTQVMAIESSKASIRDLYTALGLAEITHVFPICERAERVFRSPMPSGFAPDVVVIDPPRTGLHERIARRLPETGAKRIVYVSCNPATLARDLRVLCDGGYQLTHVEGFDMFPQTPHVEALAVVQRAT